ncbi:MAG: hypothetical protein ACXVUE_06340 [Solirubrobacteraceae bacterium]
MRRFARLSPESRYRRFLAAMPELTEEMVGYLTEVDHHDHEAIVALDDQSGREDRHVAAEVGLSECGLPNTPPASSPRCSRSCESA